MPPITNFEEWREAARACLAAGKLPDCVRFEDPLAPAGLFAERDEPTTTTTKPTFRVPKAFFDLARLVSFHRWPAKWDLLYRVLWRLKHGEPHLLAITTDEDVYRLIGMEKAVRRDAHKMKAFVRFRRVDGDDGEHFVAWHKPDHLIVRLVAPFFARRFPAMRWTILTPDESVTWYPAELSYGPGPPASAAPAPDRLETLWKAYYAATFNPARIRLKAMKKELPVRHWPTLPETELIPRLLAEAERRVELMIARQEGFATSASQFIPPNADWPTLKSAAANCRGCELCHHATQTVFSEGPLDARIALVGEQPGDYEDRAGRPFVGPAGDLLNEVLREAGIARETVYATNAVKHFKHEVRGKARIRKKPGHREVAACKPWVEAELSLVKPRVMVCMGVTAAQALIGRDFRVNERRSEVVVSDYCLQTIATYHPAAILRMTGGPNRDRMRDRLVADLKHAALLAHQ